MAKGVSVSVSQMLTWHLVWCHVVSCGVVLRHVSCHVVSCYVVSCGIMLCQVVSCWFMLCQVMSCCVESYRVVLDSYLYTTLLVVNRLSCSRPPALGLDTPWLESRAAHLGQSAVSWYRQTRLCPKLCSLSKQHRNAFSRLSP